MLKEYTCIICPNGCAIEAQVEGNNIVSMEGALCARGREYVKQELQDPQRNIASSVRVLEGELPLASVRLTAPIPKGMIFAVMEAIKGVTLLAPVRAGQVVIADVLGLGRDVIATKDVAAQPVVEQ